MEILHIFTLSLSLSLHRFISCCSLPILKLPFRCCFPSLFIYSHGKKMENVKCNLHNTLSDCGRSKMTLAQTNGGRKYKLF